MNANPQSLGSARLQEAQDARDALEKRLLALVTEYEAQFPGCAITDILVHHDYRVDARNGTTRAIAVTVKL